MIALGVIIVALLLNLAWWRGARRWMTSRGWPAWWAPAMGVFVAMQVVLFGIAVRMGAGQTAPAWMVPLMIAAGVWNVVLVPASGVVMIIAGLIARRAGVSAPSR